MEVILKNNGALEYIHSQGINENYINATDDLVQVLSVHLAVELSDNESLWIAFEQDGDIDYTYAIEMLKKAKDKCVVVIPNDIVNRAGTWHFQIFRRRYKTPDRTGVFSQIPSTVGEFTVGEGVKYRDTEYVKSAAVQTLYDAAVASATAAEAAKVATEKSESNANSYADSALEYMNEAKVAAENAAAEATEKATKAAADAETAREAAVAAKDAAEIAQADAESAATAAAAEAVREVTERINATDTKVNDLKTDIAVLNNALQIGGITYKADTETAYTERITADGLNVLDGSKAILKKVVGSTVKCNNLIPKLAEGQTFDDNNGVYYQVKADGRIIIGRYTSNSGGTPTEASVFTVANNLQLVVGEKCTISGCPVSTGLQFAVRVNKDGKWQKQYDNTNGNPVSFTVEEGYEYMVQIYVATATFSGQAVILPMLNYGDTALPYETYYSGLKSASFAGIESTRKNLFDTSFIQDTNYANGSSVIVNADGTIRVVKKAGDRIDMRSIRYLPKGTYTLSSGLDGGSLVYLDLIGTGATTVSKASNTFTWAGGNVEFVLYSENTVADTTVLLKPQLEYGMEATVYEPYKSEVFSFPKTPTPMATTIDFKNKKIIEGSKEIVLNGTENWRQGSTINNGKYRFVDALSEFFAPVNDSVIQCISSVYKNNSSGVNWNGDTGVSVSGTNINIYDEAFATKTVEEFKAHLKKLYDNGTPVVVRYLLATPIEKLFTDEQSASGNQYRAYSGGTENVLGNDNAEYGAKNTLTQNYIAIKE